MRPSCSPVESLCRFGFYNYPNPKVDGRDYDCSGRDDFFKSKRLL